VDHARWRGRAYLPYFADRICRAGQGRAACLVWITLFPSFDVVCAVRRVRGARGWVLGASCLGGSMLFGGGFKLCWWQYPGLGAGRVGA